MSTAEDALAYDCIIPDEVKRLRIHPGETLLVRANGLTPHDAQRYQEYLEAALPGIPALVVFGDEISVVATGEEADDDDG